MIVLNVKVDGLKFVVVTVLYENSVNAHLNNVPKWQPVGASNMERRYTTVMLNNSNHNRQQQGKQAQVLKAT